MSNRSRKITANDTPSETASALVGNGHQSDADAMIAELQAALAQSKKDLEAAKAERPKQTRAPRAAKVVTLADVVEKQAKTPPKWAILGAAAFVEARTAQGQDEADAIHEVMAEFERVTAQLMEYRHETPERATQTLMLCAWDFFSDVYKQAKPKTNPHPFQKKTATEGTEPEEATSETEQSALEEVIG